LYNCGLTSAGENLALHKSYTFSPKPNYRLCTDGSDITQLTDGGTFGSQWTKKSTVGWEKAEPAVEIVIDLGQPSAVYEVRIHTVGGGRADVEFPEFAAVLLSDDGRVFRFAGLIGSKESQNVRGSGYRGVPGILKAGNINAAGRYVKLVIRPKQRYVFLDEVEVFGDSLSAAKKTQLHDNLEVFKTSRELLESVDDYLQLSEDAAATVKSVKENRARLARQMSGGLSGQFSEEILAELEILAKKVDMPANKIYPTSELPGIRGRLGQIRAGIYKAVYGKPFVCLPANPMEIVFEKEMLLREHPKGDPLRGPQDALRRNQIDVRLWQNEYESAAFNIVNCSDEAITTAVSVSPLAGPAGEVDSDRTFTVRRAIYVKGSTVGSIADALVLQAERPFTLQPGELTQIWLTIFNPELAAGDYKASIGISAKTANGKVLPIESIAVAIEVQKKKFPENFALSTCNWGCYRVASMSETAKDFYSHHINVCFIDVGDIPFPRSATETPGVFGKPDFTKMDEVLATHNYARTYLLFLNFRSDKKDYGRFGKWMTPSWKAVFSSWLKELVTHLKDAGVGYDRWVLHPFDESLCDEYFELAKLVKSMDPQIRLYANSFGKGPTEFMRFRELIDIWCLQDSQCDRNPNWLEIIKGFGRKVWTYECLGPAKAKDPYSYYRLMPWRAFKRGQTGAGFWVYYDGLNYKNVAVPWNDTLKPLGYYGVIYGAQTSPLGKPAVRLAGKLSENIVSSRRWEAWREGVEDYQYLYDLQQAINEIKTKDPQMAKTMQETLERQVNRVLNSQDDSNVVYDARRVLSDALLKLTSPAPPSPAR
jgi:hypothetical protein